MIIEENEQETSYEVLLSKILMWPSLTVSFISKKQNVYKLIVGTHTTDNEANYLIVLNAELDKNKAELEIVSKIPHNGKVIKARPMPQQGKHNIIATQTVTGEIHIFDCIKNKGKKKDSIVKPELRLRGQNQEGRGLEWNKLTEGLLLSSSSDNQVFIWDVNTNYTSLGLLYPLKVFDAHIGLVTDVSWNSLKPDLFASCGEDKKIIFYDIRGNSPIKSIEGHSQSINSMDFNKTNENLLLTGSHDHTVALWDIRNLKVKLHSFNFHSRSVTEVKWNEGKDNVFTSSSLDNTIIIWDTNKIGFTKSIVEEEEGPPELKFLFTKHTAGITGFDSINTEDNSVIYSSVDDQNNIHLWKSK